MKRADIEKARAELNHALDALEDGAGQEVWGPGRVIARLAKRALKEPAATHAEGALADASDTAYNVLHLRARVDLIDAIRRLAPLFLEMRLEKLEKERDEFEARMKAWKDIAMLPGRTIFIPPAHEERSALRGDVIARCNEASLKLAESPATQAEEPPRCCDCGALLFTVPDGFGYEYDCLSCSSK